jgi:hypothetical protein
MHHAGFKLKRHLINSHGLHLPSEQHENDNRKRTANASIQSRNERSNRAVDMGFWGKRR